MALHQGAWMSTSLIIPAAGLGTRMHFPLAKQFYEIGGMPVILHVLKRADMISEIDEIIVALRDAEIDLFQDETVKDQGLTKEIKVVAGGKTRQESVYAALLAVDSERELVMVHDAVRPLVTPDILVNAIARTKELKATVTAVKVKDTIKEVDGDKITKTLDRDNLYMIQTPQTFSRSLLFEAHENALKNGITGTDDAKLVEELGQDVFIVPGSYDNLKITTYDDFFIAESILKMQKKSLHYS
jgi:2-C-methyl-D-erythritol 4-phosphate cytidylyltransferase